MLLVSANQRPGYNASSVEEIWSASPVWKNSTLFLVKGETYSVYIQKNSQCMLIFQIVGINRLKVLIIIWNRAPALQYWMGIHKDVPGPKSNPVAGLTGWYWQDGTPYNTSLNILWGEGEPSGYSLEQCARINRSNGHWWDKECAAQFFYTCKIFI